jgi:hypothetical protein
MSSILGGEMQVQDVKGETMRELVLFYTYMGHSALFARNCAKRKGRDLCEVKAAKKYKLLYCYLIGCFKSIRGKQMPIKPISQNFEGYDLVQVFAPIWAGHIAPVMNTALSMLPRGTKLVLHMVSAGGKSARTAIEKNMSKLGLEVISYEDIKTVPYVS